MYKTDRQTQLNAIPIPAAKQYNNITIMLTSTNFITIFVISKSQNNVNNVLFICSYAEPAQQLMKYKA